MTNKELIETKITDSNGQISFTYEGNQTETVNFLAIYNDIESNIKTINIREKPPELTFTSNKDILSLYHNDVVRFTANLTSSNQPMENERIIINDNSLLTPPSGSYSLPTSLDFSINMDKFSIAVAGDGCVKLGNHETNGEGIIIEKDKLSFVRCNNSETNDYDVQDYILGSYFTFNLSDGEVIAWDYRLDDDDQMTLSLNEFSYISQELISPIVSINPQSYMFLYLSNICFSGDTLSNGNLRCKYNSQGNGDKTFNCYSPGFNLQKNYTIEDCIYYDPVQYNFQHTGTTVSENSSDVIYKNWCYDNYNFSANMCQNSFEDAYEWSFDIKSTGVIEGNEHRIFLTSSNYLTNGQPSQAVYFGFNTATAMEYGYRNGSTNWTRYYIEYKNKWQHCKVIKRNSSWAFYINDNYINTLSYSGLNNVSDLTFKYIMWYPGELSVKNIKLKKID